MDELMWKEFEALWVQIFQIYAGKYPGWITAALAVLAFVVFRTWLEKKMQEAAWLESERRREEEFQRNVEENAKIAAELAEAADKTNEVLTPVEEKKPRPAEPR